MTKYGLVWEDHPEPILEDIKNGTIITKEYKDKRLIGDENGPQNVLFEGDNLIGLSLLKDEGVKVDVIYIDPPYNTGNGFIYKDKIVDNEDGYRHSKWLSFMSKRLELAYDLLSDDGVIFVSIDDNEQANLKLLMDKIFGENNFITQYSWINNLKGRQISQSGPACTHEYILTYSKDIDNIDDFFVDIDHLKSTQPNIYLGFNYEEQFDSLGGYVIKNELYNSNSIFNEVTRPNLVYDILVNKETKDISFARPNDDVDECIYYRFRAKVNNSGKADYHAWRWSKDKVVAENYNLYFDYEKLRVYTKVRNYKDTLGKDVIMGITSDSGTSDLRRVMGPQAFDHPKPLKLIEYLLRSINNKSAIVLDFFAGSGTTAQAAMELNKEDGGNRQFILMTNNEVEDGKVFNLAKSDEDVVQLLKANGISLNPYKGTGSVAKNEKRKSDIESFFHNGEGKDFFNSDIVQDEGICRKVTYERIRRVIEGDYANPRKNEVIKPLPNNLRYYKLEVE